MDSHAAALDRMSVEEQRGAVASHAAPVRTPSPRVIVDAVVRGWKTVAGTTAVAAALGVIAAFEMPPSYEAVASFVSLQSPSAGVSALQQVGGLAPLAAGAGGLKRSEDLYAALLKTDLIQDSLVDSFSLVQRYKVDVIEAARRKLNGRTSVYVDKSGLVKLSVSDRDPAVAAKMANAYVEALKKSLGEIAVSEARQRREFLEARLREAKGALIDAERRMRETQERTGLVALDKQGEAVIRGAAEIRAQIASREVQMNVARTYATARNPDVLRLASELEGLRRQLQQAESGPSASAGTMPPADSLPGAGLEYERALRDVKFNGAIFEMLARQYEVARLDEARGGAQLQQVDVARLPTERSGLPRAVLVLVGALLGSLAGVATLFMLELRRVPAGL